MLIYSLWRSFAVFVSGVVPKPQPFEFIAAVGCERSQGEIAVAMDLLPVTKPPPRQKNLHIRLSVISTKTNEKRWSNLTRHQAPHKPFVLLSVMDLIAQGVIAKNFISPSMELVDSFNTYWSAVMPIGKTTSMAYPYTRLRTDGFWVLVPQSGCESRINMDFSSMKKVREIVEGARMDDELLQHMCLPRDREQLRLILVKTYFEALQAFQWVKIMRSGDYG